MGELIEKLNCCGGGPPKRTLQIKKKWKIDEINFDFLLFCCASRGAALFVWFGFWFFFLVGYGRGTRQWLRRKEKTATNHPSPFNLFFIYLINLIAFLLISLAFLQWNEVNLIELWNGMKQSIKWMPMEWKKVKKERRKQMSRRATHSKRNNLFPLCSLPL